jgi:hypothetical protein
MADKRNKDDKLDQRVQQLVTAFDVLAENQKRQGEHIQLLQRALAEERLPRVRWQRQTWLPNILITFRAPVPLCRVI